MSQTTPDKSARVVRWINRPSEEATSWKFDWISGAIYSWAELYDRFLLVANRDRHDLVYFYRHGTTKYNELHRISGRHNTELSERGKKQATALAKSLPRHIDLLVSSKLTRSIETLELSTKRRSTRYVARVEDARLNEISLGILEGRKRRYVPQFEAGDIDFAPADGETYRDAARRILSATVDIIDLLAQTGPSPRTAVVFCHAGVLRVLATLLSASDTPKDVFKTDLANGDCIVLDTKAAKLPIYWITDGTKHNRITHSGRRSRIR